MLTFSESEIVSRPTTKEDIPYVMLHEAESSKFATSWTQEQHLHAISNENIAHLIVEVDEQPVAFLILQGITDPYTLEFMRIVVSDPGRGYGRKILKSVKRFAFEEREYNRLWLDVVHYNSRAIGLYLSEGFILEGKLREVDFFNDQFNSLYILSLLRSEYRI